MKAIMCSIFDITTSLYKQPFYAMNEEDAKRAFKMILKSNDLMKDNPSDFELYKVGYWEDETGIFSIGNVNTKANTVIIEPIRLFKGGEVINEARNTRNTL